MTLLEKIDSLLKWLYDNSDTNPKYSDIHLAILAKKLDMSNEESEDCLRKLFKDGYVHFNSGDKEPTSFHIDLPVLITFSGKYFYETTRGYQNMYESSDAEKQWQRHLWEQGDSNAKRLNSLTGWLAFGTILLAAVEIVKLALEYC